MSDVLDDDRKFINRLRFACYALVDARDSALSPYDYSRLDEALRLVKECVGNAEEPNT